MMRLVLLALSLAVGTVSASAQIVFQERYLLPVNAIGDKTFEVVERSGAGGTQMWCAAGIYATRHLGLNTGDLYVLEGYGPSQTMPGRRGVVFSAEPVDGAFQSFDQGVRKAGKTFRIGHATALCGELSQVRIRTGGRVLRR